jgi:hypothetical protein
MSHGVAVSNACLMQQKHKVLYKIDKPRQPNIKNKKDVGRNKSACSPTKKWYRYGAFRRTVNINH